MSKTNKKYKPTIGVYEIKQLLDITSPDELIRVLCDMERLGLIDIEKRSTGKKNK